MFDHKINKEYRNEYVDTLLRLLRASDNEDDQAIARRFIRILKSEEISLEDYLWIKNESLDAE